MLEKDFEEIICKYSELIEDGLILIRRQLSLYGRRMDILFEDKFKRKLIIELKAGPIKDDHIGQILSYEGMLLSAEDPTIRVMLIGTRVPPNIQRSLDHHGISWREINFSFLKGFLSNKDDESFNHLFEYEPPNLKEKILAIDIKLLKQSNFKIEKIESERGISKTVNQHLQGASDELKDLFERIDIGIREISSEVKRHTSTKEIIYTTSINFVYLAVQNRNNCLKLYLRTTYVNLIDSKNLTKPHYKNQGNITRQLRISPKDEKDGKFIIEDIMDLIHQSYESSQ